MRIAAITSVTVLVLGAMLAISVNSENSDTIVDLISKVVVVVPTLIVVQQVVKLEQNMNSKMDEALKVQRAAGKAEGIKEEQDKAEGKAPVINETNGSVQ